MFHIPPEGMTALYAELRHKRLMVAAQVHSHPQEAFHSKADDRWAIVRHEGALSLVVPHFAQATTLDRFLETSRSTSSQWVLAGSKVPSAEVAQSWLRIS